MGFIMSHTYSNLLFHAVWSTKNRIPYITKDINARLHGYLRSSIDENGCKALFINGVEDHVHLLFAAPLTISIPDLFESIKPSSTKWIRKSFPEIKDFSWQTGYGVFSVGKTNLQQVIKYIANQEEHHKTVSFEDEFISMLEAQGIPYNKKFVFG
jgi:putative transposase